MNTSIFFFRPCFGECSSTEPNLYDIVLLHYNKYYPAHMAEQYAKEYFKQITEQYK